MALCKNGEKYIERVKSRKPCISSGLNQPPVVKASYTKLPKGVFDHPLKQVSTTVCKVLHFYNLSSHF
jgi:hypothetical protein